MVSPTKINKIVKFLSENAITPGEVIISLLQDPTTNPDATASIHC